MGIGSASIATEINLNPELDKIIRITNFREASC